MFKCDFISVVTLWTNKIEETIEFYSRVCGLKRCECEKYHMTPAHFHIGNGFLAVQESTNQCEPKAMDFPVLAITVDNLENTRKTLNDNGIELLYGIQEDESSFWAFCKDPGGNLIEFVIWK